MAGNRIHGRDSDDDDEEDYEYDPEITLRSIVNSKTINFSIKASYTNWKPREAFRELVQNWYGFPHQPRCHLANVVH
jgi:hypothetical protein